MRPTDDGKSQKQKSKYDAEEKKSTAVLVMVDAHSDRKHEMDGIEGGGTQIDR